MNMWLAISVCLMLLASLPAGFAAELDWKGFMTEGYTRLRAGDFQGAIQAFRAAAQLAEQPGYSLDRRALSLNAMAMSYDELGRFADSERLYQRSLAALEQVKGREDPLYAAMLANLGGSYTSQGRTKEAEQTLREAIAIHRRATPISEIGLAMAQNRLAKVLMNVGRYSEAEEPLLESQRALEAIPTAGLQLSMAIHNRAALLAHQRHFIESAEMFERSLVLTEKELGNDHPMLIQTLVNLGTVYTQAGDFENAKRRLDRAMPIAKQRLGTEHPVYGLALTAYAELLKKTGHKSEAKTASARAKEIQQSNARVNGHGMSIDISSLRSQ